MITLPGRTFFKHQPVEMRGVEAMHGGEAVATVADIGGDAFCARNVDGGADEPLFDGIVDLRQADDAHIDAILQ